MLSPQECQQVLVFLGYFCKARLLPAEVCTEHWELSQRFHTAGRSGLIPKIFYALFAVHGLYKVLSLVNVLLFATGIPLHEAMIHAVMAIDCVTFGYWYYVLYIKYAEVYAALLRMTLTRNLGQSKTNNYEIQFMSIFSLTRCLCQQWSMSF